MQRSHSMHRWVCIRVRGISRSIPLFPATSISISLCYCKTRAEDETRNSDKRNRSLTSFGKLSGMQADSVALERNFTNISRLGKLHFARWIIVMRVKDLYCNMVYVCDCIYTWKIFARNFVIPNTP